MILRGWKEICAYLSVSVNTAKRLVREQNLPVAFLNGTPMALKEELEAWLKNIVKQK